MAAKVESVSGTAEALTASEGVFNVYNPVLTPEVGFTEREGQSSFDRLPGVPQGRGGRLTFSVDLVGKGSSGVPDWASVFLQGCGCNNGSGGTFSFVTGSSSAKTLTIGLYEDGLLRSIAGSVGTFTINLTAGTAGRVDFEFLGILQAESDTALVAPDYPAIIPPRWANSSGCTYDGVSLILNTATFAAGNVLKLREDANQTSGYKAGIITDRMPTFSLDPETVLLATKNWYTNFYASTGASLSAVVGTASNNIITLTMPKAVLTAPPSRGDRDGLMTTVLSGVATRSADAGDDCWTIAFS